MIPKSISASSLNTASTCMSRYWAENIEYSRGFDNDAAKLGTTVHAALELYVTQCYIAKTHQPNEQRLYEYFDLYFVSNFGPIYADDERHIAGRKMLTKWFEETTFDDREVVSAEQKKFIMVQSSAGPIKLNYILDRFDKIGENKYEVIDYKSSFINIREDDLRRKLQGQIYALAMYWEYPQAEEMWVTFDMLRYQKTTVHFTKDDARKTYLEIKRLLEMILATDADSAQPTLNPECKFCVRKTTCPAILKNIETGGVFSMTLAEQIETREQLRLQAAAQRSTVDELDKVIEAAIGEDGNLEFKTDRGTRAYFAVPRKNIIKSIPDAMEIAGPDIWAAYAAPPKITLEQYKKLLEDSRLTEDQRGQLEALKGSEFSEASLRFEHIGEDGKRIKEADLALPVPSAPESMTRRETAKLPPIPGLDD